MNSNTKLAIMLAVAALGVISVIGCAVSGVIVFLAMGEADVPYHDERPTPVYESEDYGDSDGWSDAPAATGAVVVNGATLGEQDLRGFEEVYRVRPRPGRYWYDARSGLWGFVGQPSAGFLLPGHELGRLDPDASRGDTGVFLNGRGLPYGEWVIYSALVGGPLQPGRYWLDGQGNAGVEGNPYPQVNLYLAYQARIAAGGGGAGGGGGGGDNFWSSRFSAGNSDSGGSRGYVSVPGHGPVGYGF